MDNIFDRTLRLVGPQTMAEIGKLRVIVFGVGGVGSWCAESLVRSGVARLTLVDSDCVSPSNINRQAMATQLTLGQPKVEALRQRLLSINPAADITALEAIYSQETRELFALEDYDYVVDAIDSLQCKAELILHATSLDKRTGFVSSMGAALKIDPTQVSTAEFWQVRGCPLARALRQRFKRAKTYPRRKFQVVFSPEVLPNLGQPELGELKSWDASKAQINGTLAHITAIFGFTLAGLILNDLYHRTPQTN